VLVALDSGVAPSAWLEEPRALWTALEILTRRAEEMERRAKAKR
jgi:hypothetical protein